MKLRLNALWLCPVGVALLCVAALGLTRAAAAGAEENYDFDLSDLFSSATASLDGLTDGKPAVVYVWEVDCSHCLRHMPYASALYKKLDPKKVNFVSISMGDQQEHAKQYAESKALPFPVLDGTSGKISAVYEEEGWPTTYVFSPGGKLKRKTVNTGSAYIDEVLKLVGEKR
jgi:thiol-disulfide isomerase/thioredoxin